jgi:hypothetical protein
VAFLAGGDAVRKLPELAPIFRAYPGRDGYLTSSGELPRRRYFPETVETLRGAGAAGVEVCVGTS